MIAEVSKITGSRGTGIKLIERDNGELRIRFSDTEIKPFKFLYWNASDHEIIATHKNLDHRSNLEKLI